MLDYSSIISRLEKTGTQLIAANNKKRENAPRISSYIYGEPRIFARAHVYFDFEMIYREWISNNLNASELFFSLPLFSFRQIDDGKKNRKKRPPARSLVRYYRAWHLRARVI